MLRIWRTIGQYRFESAFSTWVYRVTASCCMDAIRKRQRHEQPSLEEMGEASGFDPADDSETRRSRRSGRKPGARSGRRLPPCRRGCVRCSFCGTCTA
ncbi:MAG: RNA polymerase sigma factor [Christensenellales bacterium]